MKTIILISILVTSSSFLLKNIFEQDKDALLTERFYQISEARGEDYKTILQQSEYIPVDFTLSTPNISIASYNDGYAVQELTQNTICLSDNSYCYLDRSTESTRACSGSRSYSSVVDGNHRLIKVSTDSDLKSSISLYDEDELLQTITIDNYIKNVLYLNNKFFVFAPPYRNKHKSSLYIYDNNGSLVCDALKNSQDITSTQTGSAKSIKVFNDQCYYNPPNTKNIYQIKDDCTMELILNEDNISKVSHEDVLENFFISKDYIVLIRQIEQSRYATFVDRQSDRMLTYQITSKLTNLDTDFDYIFDEISGIEYGTNALLAYHDEISNKKIMTSAFDSDQKHAVSEGLQKVKNSSFIHRYKINFDHLWNYGQQVKPNKRFLDFAMSPTSVVKSATIIKPTEAIDPCSYKIYDITGELHLQGKLEETTTLLDLGSLAKGRYIVRIESQDDAVIRPIKFEKR